MDKTLIGIETAKTGNTVLLPWEEYHYPIMNGEDHPFAFEEEIDQDEANIQDWFKNFQHALDQWKSQLYVEVNIIDKIRGNPVPYSVSDTVVILIPKTTDAYEMLRCIECIMSYKPTAEWGEYKADLHPDYWTWFISWD